VDNLGERPYILVNLTMSGPLGRETFTFKSSTLSFTIQNQTFCLVNEFNDKITPSNYYFNVNIFLIPTLNTEILKTDKLIKTGLYWYEPKIAKWLQNSAGEYFRTKQMDFATSLLALAQIVLHLYIKTNFFFFLTFFSKNQ